MLAKGLRDEQNERINNVFKRLIALIYIPKDWKEKELDELLQQLNLSLKNLLEFSSDEINEHLQKQNADWPNMEQFADFLIKLSEKNGYENVKQKALSLYNFIQHESKIFSFDIFNKINALK